MEFTANDIQDVKIIIKANGKHYSIRPKKGFEEYGKELRIEVAKILLVETFEVIIPPLEELKRNRYKTGA